MELTDEWGCYFENDHPLVLSEPVGKPAAPLAHIRFRESITFSAADKSGRSAGDGVAGGEVVLVRSSVGSGIRNERECVAMGYGEVERTRMGGSRGGTIATDQ